ncbi:MAG: ornithine carbamoyltransferase [Rhizobiaceae bacterium]|nr:ornithine carbamoyltransferase [Rhizobiaceae bacterium]
MSAPVNHFLDLSSVDADVLKNILSASHDMKAEGIRSRPLEGKMLAMVFDKPSTRTRVSFDVGMRQLGGETLFLSGNDMQLGRGETIADTAKVLSRYVDAIMIRTTAHSRLLELAENATVPVINGLTDDTHPCQIMADIMTIEEKLGGAKGRKLAWTGDGNNVLNSLIEASTIFGFELDIAVPKGREPDQGFIDRALAKGASITISNDPEKAVKNADCVLTDTWKSMGFEDEASGHNTFAAFQVNSALMAHAKSEAIFMHCLPAHRGEEVTDEVIDGPQSVVFDEAENRLHAQKGILKWCLAGL